MNVELWGLDRFEQVGRITTHTEVEIIERDLAAGGWSVTMPLGDVGDVGAELLTRAWPGIEVVDRDTGWRFGGYLTDHIVTIEEDGAAQLTLMGTDFQNDLSGWLEWPESTTPDEWWVTTYGGTIPATSDAHNTMRLNAGTGAAAIGRPTIDGLVLGTNPAAGPAKARRLKGEPLLDVMRFLFADSTTYTARLRLVRDVMGTGAVQFDTPARTVSPVTLDAKRGTFGKVEIRTSAAKASWVLAMGAEVEPVVTAGERYVSITSITHNSWRTRRRELAINRPATDDVAALDDEVLAVLNDPANARSQSIRVESARVDGYGRDLDLGWLVDVHLGDVFSPSTVRLPVVASRLRFTTEAGWVRTVDVGTEALPPSSAVFAQIARLRAQLRQVENDSR